MTLLSLVRLFTVVIALTYGVSHAPWDKIEMFFNPDVSIITHGSNSLLFTSGTFTIYTTPVVAVALAFLVVPRWRYGSRALSVCFFVMVLALLTRLEEPVVWQQYLSTWTRLHTAAEAIYHALPPLLLGAMLLHPIIEHQLQRARPAPRNV